MSIASISTDIFWLSHHQRHTPLCREMNTGCQHILHAAVSSITKFCNMPYLSARGLQHALYEGKSSPYLVYVVPLVPVHALKFRRNHNARC